MAQDYAPITIDFRVNNTDLAPVLRQIDQALSQFSGKISTADSRLNRFGGTLDRVVPKLRSFSMECANINAAPLVGPQLGDFSGLNRATAQVKNLKAEYRSLANTVRNVNQSVVLSRATGAVGGAAAGAAAGAGIGASLRGLTGQFLSVAAATTAVAAGLREIGEFGTVMSAVKALTEATGEEMQSLTDAALEVGSTTLFSATQAATGLKVLAQAGFTAKESQEALVGVLTLAQAGELDVATAADIATAAMATFHMRASEMANIADIFAQGANISQVSVQDLGQAMKFAGPVSAALGIELKELIAVLGVLGNAGLKADLGGTAVRQMLSKLANEGGEAIQTLEKLGVSFEEVNPATHSLVEIMKRLETVNIGVGDAFKIFGDRGQSGFNVLVRAIPLVEQFRKALDDQGAAARVSAIMADNLAGSFTLLMNSLKGFAIGLGEAGLVDDLRGLMDVMRLGVNTLKPFAQGIHQVSVGFLGLNRSSAVLNKILGRDTKPAETGKKAEEVALQLPPAQAAFRDEVDQTTSALEEETKEMKDQRRELERMKALAEEVEQIWREGFSPEEQLKLARQDLEKFMGEASRMARDLREEHGDKALETWGLPSEVTTLDQLKKMADGMQNFGRVGDSGDGDGDHTKDAQNWLTLLQKVLATKGEIKDLNQDIERKEKENADKLKKTIEQEDKRMINAREMQALESEVGGDERKADLLRDENDVLEEQRRIQEQLGLSEGKSLEMARRKIALLRTKKDLDKESGGSVDSLQAIGGGGNQFVANRIGRPGGIAPSILNPIVNQPVPTITPSSTKSDLADTRQILEEGNSFLEQILAQLSNNVLFIRAS